MNVIPLKCPRCDAPVAKTPSTPEGYECSLCTWPSGSFRRVVTTLARQGVHVGGYNLTAEGLEDFAQSIPSKTTLTDKDGRVVEAKVVEVNVHDGMVDVTFEYDPNGWRTQE